MATRIYQTATEKNANDTIRVGFEKPLTGDFVYTYVSHQTLPEYLNEKINEGYRVTVIRNLTFEDE